MILMNEIDYDKIYLYRDIEGYQYGLWNEAAILIGKIQLIEGNFFIHGFIINKEKEGKYYNAFVYSSADLREATPEEIEQYEEFKNIQKYNL